MSSERTTAPREARVLPFVYRPAPGWGVPGEKESAAGPAIGAAGKPGPVTAAAYGLPGAEEVSRAREKQAWEEGLREGFARARAEMEGPLQQQRDGVAEALRAFAHEREAYFHHVESEVVTLALAMVRKILRREAQVDPLLLTGLVRVALEKMAVSQNVRLRVHPSQVGVWQAYFSEHSDLAVIPELSGDAGLEPDRCHLETELGATDLSLETQLKEIEQGLFDLLAQRPAPS